MKTKVSFSCIITVYQGTNGRFFREAVESVLNQHLVPNEILVIMDGPVSAEVEGIIREYIEFSRCEIREVRIPKNIGSGPARNEGIKHARYEWIAVMDCDDFSLPERFSRQVDVIATDPDIDFISTLSDEYLEGFEESQYSATKKCPELSADIVRRLNYNCCITNPTVMFRKQLWEKTGGYGSFKFLNEDHYFFLKAAKANARFYCIQDSLLFVRIGKDHRKRRSGIKLFLTDLDFRWHCLRQDLINFKGFLVLLPLLLRRFTPGFMIPFFHRIWRAI